MTEIYLKRGHLIEESEWKDYIDALKSVTIKAKSAILKEKIIDSICSRIPKCGKVGVLFSGGVDSTLIAYILKKEGYEPVCYSVGVSTGNIRESPDLVYARKIAEEFDFDYREILLGIDDVEKIIKKVIPIVTADIVKVGVGAVVYAAMLRAKKDRVRYLFSGLGSEEVFAGYERHKGVGNINEECWKGLLSMYQRDLIRDVALAQHFKMTLMTPLLDKDVILYGMAIPGSKKISKTNNKLPIRRIAYGLGLPRRYAYRKKIAAQYGSNIDKAIQRLAKRSGFKYKKDYLESL